MNKRGTRKSGKQALQSSKGSDPPQQLELDFRAPVLRITWPDPQTVAFWRATADDPQEFARRLAKFSRRMQTYESSSSYLATNKKMRYIERP